MLQVIEGDLFLTDAKVVVHGCNCFNTMGAGVAAMIAERCPAVFTVDQLTKKGDREKLGTFTYAECGSEVIVVNLYSQYTFWDKSDMFCIKAFENGLREVFAEFSDEVIAMPAIGLGLANGVPEEVFYVVERLAFEYGKTVKMYVIDKRIMKEWKRFSENARLYMKT